MKLILHLIVLLSSIVFSAAFSAELEMKTFSKESYLQQKLVNNYDKKTEEFSLISSAKEPSNYLFKMNDYSITHQVLRCSKKILSIRLEGWKALYSDVCHFQGRFLLFLKECGYHVTDRRHEEIPYKASPQLAANGALVVFCYSEKTHTCWYLDTPWGRMCIGCTNGHTGELFKIKTSLVTYPPSSFLKNSTSLEGRIIPDLAFLTRIDNKRPGTEEKINDNEEYYALRCLFYRDIKKIFFYSSPSYRKDQDLMQEMYYYALRKHMGILQ